MAGHGVRPLTGGKREGATRRRAPRPLQGGFWILGLTLILLPAGVAAQTGSSGPFGPCGQRAQTGQSSAAGPTDPPGPDWLFPDRTLLPGLRGGARDPVTTGQLVYDWENPTAFGPGVAGEVAIAGAVAVARLAGSGPDDGPGDALVVGLEGAAFARFSFQVVTRELVNTDWIFTVPLVWHRGDHWLRLRYYHTSSHLGDEYQKRFGPSSVNFSRDGADLTAYARPGTGWTRDLGLAVYGLVFWSVNSHPEERPLWEVRGGLEIDPAHGALWAPFLTADVHAEEGTGWAPRWTVQAGVWLPRVQGRPLRLAVQAFTGPSPLGQFRSRDAGRVGIGLFWNP